MHLKKYVQNKWKGCQFYFFLVFRKKWQNRMKPFICENVNRKQAVGKDTRETFKRAFCVNVPKSSISMFSSKEY